MHQGELQTLVFKGNILALLHQLHRDMIPVSHRALIARWRTIVFSFCLNKVNKIITMGKSFLSPFKRASPPGLIS
jgi:hypothetical protein